MALTPLDIHHKEFRSARFGGYNEEEVDSFLDLVADEFERMIQEENELKQQIEQMKIRLSEFEEMQATLQSALLAATRSAETVREQARQDSEEIVTKAQEEADALVKAAQERASQMMLRAENETQKLEHDFGRLKEIKKQYMKGLREVAESHLLEVEELESMDESEIQPEELQTAAEPLNVEDEPASVLMEESPIQTPPQETPPVSTPPSVPETPLSEPAAQPMEEISSTPTLENSAAPQLERVVVEPAVKAPGGVPSVKADESRVAVGTGVRSRLMEPGDQVEPGRGRIDVVEKMVPSSSDLVDEVLPVKDSDRIYAEFEELKGDTEGGQRGRKGRRDKREKHFFWE